MNQINNVKAYAIILGHFWQSFNGLDLFLRLYLNRKNGKDNNYALKFLNQPMGKECEENAITDYKSFGQLCDAFNSYQISTEKIDFLDILQLRDAMAHGRVLGDEQGNMKVIKFSKPKDKKVKVEFQKLIDVTEMNSIIKRITDIGMEVTKRMGAKMPQ